MSDSINYGIGGRSPKDRSTVQRPGVNGQGTGPGGGYEGPGVSGGMGGPTCATPTFSTVPISGMLNSTEVTLRCGTEGAFIFYTTNGSTPNSSSTLYTGPFRLYSPAPVKCYATRVGKLDSAVAQQFVTVVPPAPLSISVSGYAGTLTRLESVTLRATGTFAGGVTADVTGFTTFTSPDPSFAIAGNVVSIDSAAHGANGTVAASVGTASASTPRMLCMSWIPREVTVVQYGTQIDVYPEGILSADRTAFTLKDGNDTVYELWCGPKFKAGQAIAFTSTITVPRFVIAEDGVDYLVGVWSHPTAFDSTGTLQYLEEYRQLLGPGPFVFPFQRTAQVDNEYVGVYCSTVNDTGTAAGTYATARISWLAP